MGELRHLWALPLITCVVSLLGISLPSIIGAAEGHLQWILPFISDGGAFAPEKNIFSALQNISAVMIALTMYVKYLQFVTYFRNRRTDGFWRLLAAIELAFGLIAAFGLSLVGDFSEMDVPDAHNVSAMITFVSAAIYLCLSAGLSFLRPLLCSPLVAGARVLLAALTVAMLVFHTAVLQFDLFFPPSANVTAYDGDDHPVFLDYDSPYFAHHTIATASEWALALLIFLYLITFIEEFRKATLTLPSINFHSDRTNAREKQENVWT